MKIYLKKILINNEVLNKIYLTVLIKLMINSYSKKENILYILMFVCKIKVKSEN